jgi:hypothetical protein
MEDARDCAIRKALEAPLPEGATVSGRTAADGTGHAHGYALRGGDGTTSDASGHRHQVRGWLVMPAAGHVHVLDRVHSGARKEASEHGMEPGDALRTAVEHVSEHPNYYRVLESVNMCGDPTRNPMLTVEKAGKPIGSTSQRADGTWRKVGEGDWRKVPEGRGAGSAKVGSRDAAAPKTLKMTRGEYAKMHRDYKGMHEGKPHALTNEGGATVMRPVEFTDSMPESGKGAKPAGKPARFGGTAPKATRAFDSGSDDDRTSEIMTAFGDSQELANKFGVELGDFDTVSDLLDGKPMSEVKRLAKEFNVDLPKD